MKTFASVVTLCLIALGFTPSRGLAMPPPPPTYSAQLISPTAGQTLYPGQTIRVEWRTRNPNPLRWPLYCEVELWLSLDGGATYTLPITASMDPNVSFFYWTVPNTPTNSAVLDVRFGCEPFYAETYNPQTASRFVIAALSN